MADMIVIDGASSAGKTSLVSAFAEIAGEAYRPYSIDGFLPCLAPGVFEARARTDKGWIAICADFHRNLAGLRSPCAGMIVEVMLPWPEARQDLFRQIGRDQIYYVQLFCSLHELERREKQRRDRNSGLARSHFERVYSFAEYDLRIDSTALAPEQCARILAAQRS